MAGADPMSEIWRGDIRTPLVLADWSVETQRYWLLQAAVAG